MFVSLFSRSTGIRDDLEFLLEEELSNVQLCALHWLEYLHLVFFFKCKCDDINLNIHNYIQCCKSKSRRGSSEIYVNTPPFKTCLFRDSFFNRQANLWNAIPDSIKSQTSISSFKNKLKYFFVERLKIVFDGDNIRSYKLICPKCRRANPMTICSC